MVEKTYELSIGVDGSLDRDEAIAQASNCIEFEVDIIDVYTTGGGSADWSILITVAVDDEFVNANDLYWNQQVDTVEEVSIGLQ
jgi:hypothetical protein